MWNATFLKRVRGYIIFEIELYLIGWNKLWMNSSIILKLCRWDLTSISYNMNGMYLLMGNVQHHASLHFIELNIQIQRVENNLSISWFCWCCMQLDIFLNHSILKVFYLDIFQPTLEYRYMYLRLLIIYLGTKELHLSWILID